MAQPLNRTCLHCALERALRAEAAEFQRRGIHVSIEPSVPVLVPVSGMRIYRELRVFLRRLQTEAEGVAVKLSVLGWLAGKSDVEVTAVYNRAGRWRVLSQSFPRYIEDLLWHGFAEFAYVGD